MKTAKSVTSTPLQTRSAFRTFTTAILIATFSQISYGFTVHQYLDLEGDSVNYRSIRESTATETQNVSSNQATTTRDPTILYGQPTITGNILSFDDPNFTSLSGTENGSDVTDGRLSFSIETDPGMYIRTLTLDEFGLVSLTSTNPDVNSSTLARIQAPAFLTVNTVMLDNGDTLQLPIATRLVTELQISPNETVLGGGWDADSPPTVQTQDDDGNIVFVPTSAWEGRVQFNILDMLANIELDIPAGRRIVGATELEYDMNNTLTTFAEVGQSTAFIDKKGISIFPDLVPIQVPEPGVGLMLLMAVSGFAIVRRRR